jgi:SAM-dependent methyltransferase
MSPANQIGSYQQALACPNCHQPLALGDDGAACTDCGARYPDHGSYLDFVGSTAAMPIGLGPLLLNDPLHVGLYERHTRAAFLKIMGANWNGELSEHDEDHYLEQHLGPTPEGPVLDLACGAGRWTRTLAACVGVDRLIGLDLNVAMLDQTRIALPEILLVRASAGALPFADQSLAGVNCSNALQVLPSPHRVIAEIGRCLQPAGIFTAFTFRRAENPLYAYLQHQHATAFNVRPFDERELKRWLHDASMRLADITVVCDCLLFAATRQTHMPGARVAFISDRRKASSDKSHRKLSQ